MEKDKQKTTVQFRLEKSHPEEVFAFFPNLPEWSEKRLKTLPEGATIGGRNKNELRQLFLCYTHVGQHGTCHTQYFMECEPATKDQYKDLQKELEGLGYNLTILA